MQCLHKNQQPTTKRLRLPANATLIVEACGEVLDTPLDFDRIRALGSRPNGPIAVSLTTDGGSADFAAFGIAIHGQNGSDRFLSSANFADPKMAMSSTNVFTGVPVGRSKLLADGEYTPNIAVANFATRPVNISVKLAVSEPGRSSQFNEIRKFTQPPGSTAEVSLDGLEGNSTLQNSFLVTYEANPGEVLTSLSSRGSASLQQVDLIGKDEMDGENAGGHPWSISEGNLATLLLFNPSNKIQRIAVRIAGVNARWEKDYELKAHETRAVSINDVIEEQTKDKGGRSIPLTLKAGVVSWWTNEPGQGKGRLLESNPATAMARNYSCGQFIVLCGTCFSPGTMIWESGLDDFFGSVSGQTCYARTGSGGSADDRSQGPRQHHGDVLAYDGRV
jgi:hypothetical protein